MSTKNEVKITEITLSVTVKAHCAKVAKNHTAIFTLFQKMLPHAKAAGEAIKAIQAELKDVKPQTVFQTIRDETKADISDRTFYLYLRVANEWEALLAIVGETGLEDLTMTYALSLITKRREKKKQDEKKDEAGEAGAGEAGAGEAGAGAGDKDGEALNDSQKALVEKMKQFDISIPVVKMERFLEAHDAELRSKKAPDERVADMVIELNQYLASKTKIVKVELLLDAIRLMSELAATGRKQSA